MGRRRPTSSDPSTMTLRWKKKLPIEAALTPKEIQSHLNKLKNGKATGLDLLSNEMLKCVGPTCLPFLTQLFNHIYNTSSFPSSWKEAYITTLHKKGPKQDPANYRPISITSCLGKLFTGTLNTRLMQFMQDANISHPFQGAFTKGRRSTDHIFVANTLIDQAKHLGHPLYAAFIDMQKAYDSVSRPLLFRKLVLSGLGPKFCSLVEQTYTNTSSRIKLGTRMGESFSSNVGLCQGEPLSPLLFNLFIADLIFAFHSNCDPPHLHDLPVPSIQFSDDICNFSTTPAGIRQSINTTIEYCRANRLTVNISKSLTAIRLPPNLTSPLLTNYSGMTPAHATLAYAFPTLNKTSAKSCSEKPPRQHSHCDLCWTTRLQLHSLTPFMPSSLNPSFSTGWNNGYPMSTPERWLKKAPPPHMPPPPPNSQRTKPIRIWPMPTISSTPPPPHWLSGLNLGRIQHISRV